jgi:hypothetical protein
LVIINNYISAEKAKPLAQIEVESLGIKFILHKKEDPRSSFRGLKKLRFIEDLKRKVGLSS